MAKKILITEDSPTILAIIEQTLTEAGYEVITALDGQQALDKARKESPDLLVLDLMLPKMDGFTVCRMLKFDERYSNIPVVIMTARSQEADKKMGAQVGANAYITKPVDPEVLLKTIKDLLV